MTSSAQMPPKCEDRGIIPVMPDKTKNTDGEVQDEDLTTRDGCDGGIGIGSNLIVYGYGTR
jgi:hypothetical protein